MKWILAFATLATIASPAHAQGPTRLGLSSRSVATLSTTRMMVDSVPHSHWVEGMMIGGIVGAALGALLNHIGTGISDVSHNNGTVVILGAAALGAVIGGLIGSGSHPKS